MARPRGKRTAVRLSIGFDQQTYGSLLAFADHEDATVAWVIRRAVSDFLSNHPTGEPELPLIRNDSRAAPHD
jgi:hypothetical protein